MRILALLFLVSILAPPAVADSKRDWADCASDDPKRGMPACTRIIARGKDSRGNLATAYSNRGIYAAMQGDYDRAIQEHTEAIRLSPAPAFAYNLRGDNYWNKGDYDRAVSDYSEAIRRDPNNVDFYLDRGDVYLRNKSNFEAALADYGKAIELKPKHAAAYLGRGLSYENKGDVVTALADYSEAIRLAPDDAENYNVRGNGYGAQKDFARAAADYGEAIRLKPENGSYWQNRGWAKRENGDLDGAVADLTEAIRLLPQDPAPLTERAWTLDKKKDYDAAIRDLDAALVLAPESGDALNGQCWVRAQKGDLDRAIVDCDRAVVALPNDPVVLHNRALVQTRRAALASALTDFDRAIELDPERAGYYADRGHAFELKGDRERAIADYKKALGLKSKQPYDDTAKEEALKRLTDLAALGPAAKIEMVEKERQDAKPVAPAEPDKRIALVIGNSQYQNTAVLKNPANDSRAVAASLRRLGFDEVIEQHDLTLNEMSAALKSFGDRANGMDWAVIYYAGHGIEIGGTNYVIPVDAALKSVTHVDDEAVPLQRMLAKVEGAHKMRLVILDACRDNPFAAKIAQASGATRSVGRGLARVEPVPGVLVAYAARDGQVAQDGDADNSPYAAALVEQLEQPGVEIDLMFRRVGARVRKATNGQQVPFTYGSLPDDALYFNPGPR